MIRDFQLWAEKAKLGSDPPLSFQINVDTEKIRRSQKFLPNSPVFALKEVEPDVKLINHRE